MKESKQDSPHIVNCSVACFRSTLNNLFKVFKPDNASDEDGEQCILRKHRRCLHHHLFASQICENNHKWFLKSHKVKLQV